MPFYAVRNGAITENAVVGSQPGSKIRLLMLSELRSWNAIRGIQMQRAATSLHIPAAETMAFN